MKRMVKGLWIAGGSLSVALGVIGIFFPVLPTTPFLLLAAFCYARSSERFYHWLLNNRWFGAYIRNYREGRGIPLTEKILAICSLWLTIGFSVFFVVQVMWVKLLLLAIAVGVTIHLVRIKTLRKETGVVAIKRVEPSEEI
jgi:uncharacterized membrane protein YbaN (DUF454 family)